MIDIQFKPSSRPENEHIRERQEQRSIWQRIATSKLMLSAFAIAACVAIAAMLMRGRGNTPAAFVADTVAAGENPAASSEGDSTITLYSTAQRLAGVELLTVSANNSGLLIANGTITYDANRVSVISSRAEGRLTAVRADLGQHVRAGTVLANIESSDVGQTRGDLERARVNVEVARANYEREKRLFDEQITPQKELLDAEGAFRAAQADFDAAGAKLRAVGASSGSGAKFGLSTPIDGTVVERNASPGQVVGPTSNLFTVADLRHVWITVDVYEGDVARVRRDATATVSATALPGRSFKGIVSYAGGIVDPASHTFKVRVDVANDEQDLRPGMFAQVRIVTPSVNVGGETDASPSVAIPEIAVQELNGKSIVFVARETPGVFVARVVTVGVRSGDGNIIVAGLAPGERIAVRGAFQLKAELTKASFAGGD